MQGAKDHMIAGPSVTVVITTYNHAHFLGEALVSVVGQSYPPSQIIVVDDGSRDDPAQVVRMYDGVQYIRIEHRGPSATRNAGLAAARGEYISFLDADDRLHTDALASGLETHSSHPGSAFVYGAHRRVDRQGRAMGPIRYLPVLAEPFAGFLRGNFVGMHGTVLYNRAVLVAASGFDETLRYCEDYELFLRLAAQHPIASDEALTADYRIHGENASLNHRAMLKGALAVQAKYWNR